MHASTHIYQTNPTIMNNNNNNNKSKIRQQRYHPYSVIKTES